LLADTVALRAMRVVRVIRPLKGINAIPSLRKQIKTLINSMPRFLHVALFLLFVLTIMSILAVNQFSGLLYGRCRFNPIPETPTSWKATPDFKLCSNNSIGYQCPDGLHCGFPTDFGISLEDDGVYENP
jgi:hypothetical protein